MKKLMCMLTCFVLLLLCACQPTPEKPVVIQKDMEQMLEKAQAAPEADLEASPETSLSERYAIPQQMKLAITGAEGRLSISIDAPVTVPERELPLARVSPAQFGQDTVTAFYDALVGDTPMINVTNVLTKADIQKSILYYQQIADGLLEGSLVTPEEAREELEKLEEEYKKAPEKVEQTMGDSTLKKQSRQLGNNMGYLNWYGVDLKSEDGNVLFHAQNDYNNDKAYYWDTFDSKGNNTGGVGINVLRNASMYFYDRSKRGEDCRFGSDGRFEHIERTAPIPDKAKAFLSVTPDGAAAQAEALLTQLGLDDTFKAKDIYLVWNGYKDEYRDIPLTAYAYQIMCARTLNGASIAYALNVGASSPQNDEKEEWMAPMWFYESFSIIVGEDGICSLEWSAPMSIDGIISDDSTLLPFSEIEGVAEKMLGVIYEARAKESEYVESLKLNIDRVELSLQRIAQRDYFDSGLLVPAWSFSGTLEQTLNWRDGSTYTYTETGTFLTINAVDGSIIDLQKGY